MSKRTLSPSYAIAMRVRIPNHPGMLGKVATAIGDAGGGIGAVNIVTREKDSMVREITVDTSGLDHARAIVDAVGAVDGVSVLDWLDITFEIHRGGKISQVNKMPLATRDDLSRAYTPGVARVCMAIAADRSLAYDYTIKNNMVAVVSDGTAVLGLGDIGPEAAMPVMEGKAMLFREFGKVEAFPICVATKDTEEIIKICKYLEPTFGGINLEDISAPRCFEIEERLKKELDIPVFHDDQHGTAVVVLAALYNALRIVKKRIENLKIVILGVGAAGVACSKILLKAGVRNIIGCDREGIIYKGRKEHMNFMKEWYAENTNPEGVRGSLKNALKDADLFLGLSGPNLFKPEWVDLMARDSIVFAMSNPDPEVRPEDIRGKARIIATGRSDYPNQINNVLCFPGLFRGALDVRARDINEEMKLAAAKAIAALVSESDLSEDFIIPSVFDTRVGESVAREVARAARETGVARRPGLPA
jgi:malate dehydrogenase (oxaloacetate-decarboxylating)